MRARLEVLATVTLVVAALATVAVVVDREFSGPPTAQLVDTLTLAPPDGVAAEEFTFVRSVRELDDGRTLVTESGTGLRGLAIVDWESGEVSSVGRRGDGPLEYRAPGELHALRGDSTFLLDRTTRGYYVLHGARIVEKGPPDDPLKQVFQFPSLMGADGAGHVVGLRRHTWDESLGPSGMMGPDSFVVLRVDRASLAEDTLARTRGPGVTGLCMRVRRRLPSGELGPASQTGGCSPIFGEEAGVLFDDGWLAIARVEPYRVDWRAPDGRWVHGPPLPFTPRRLDAAERCAAVQGWAFYGLRDECKPEELAGIEWPEELPPFPPPLGQARTGMSAPRTPVLFATPGGRVLIRRTPSLDRMESRYDLVDRRGRLAAVLRLPLNEAVVGFGRSHVFVVETDPLDLQRLRRHPWPMP